MKTYGIVIIGQSNEQGPAAYYESGQLAKFNSIYGRPSNDLVVDGTKSPTAWRGTAWSLLGSKLFSRRGINVIWRNAAVGGTGVFDSWAGGATTWESGNANGGFGVSAASWILPTIPNGFKYKVNASGLQHATTEPTWNTTIGGSTTDNALTLTTYAADNNDVPGRAYSRGESGYDPLGYIAAAKAMMTTLMAKSPNLDEYMFFVSGNQADLAFRYKTPLMRFGAICGLVNDLLISFPKAKIGIGLTCYWDTGFETGQRPRSYEAVLYPSYIMALNRYHRSKRVFSCGDWFTGLGKSINYATGGTTAIHMAPDTTENASEVSYNACIASALFERG